MNQFESRSVGRNFNNDDGFGVTQVISTNTPLAYQFSYKSVFFPSKTINFFFFNNA